MTLIFAVVSLVLVAIGVHMMTGDIQTVINSSGIMVNSQSWLHRSNKQCQLDDIERIHKRTNGSMGQGSSAVLFYTLFAQLKDNSTLEIGNGVKGKLATDALIKVINQTLDKLQRY